MAVYKRGGKWWYSFVFNGERVQKSTKQSNKRTAEQMEAAHKTALAKGEVGIVERKVVPRLREFEERFMAAILVHCANKPRTVTFYQEKLTRLLEFEPLANARLNEIDEGLIETWVQARCRVVAPATVNRSLATLRRLLRLAYEWKVINRVPRIRLLPGERNRTFVLSAEQELKYLGAAPQPLKDVALLILETGLRVGEALALKWTDIRLEPTNGTRFGFLQIRDGKSRNAVRTVSLTERATEMLRNRIDTNPEWVFAARSGRPYVGTSLAHLHQRVREEIELPDDFVIHSLRHTMLSRLGDAGVDAFTIMRIAGHSSVAVSERYVHPANEALERAFERLEDANRKARTIAPLVPEVATVSATVVEMEAA